CHMRKTLFLCLFLLFGNVLFAQEVQLLASRGFLIPHRPSMRGLPITSAHSISFIYWRNHRDKTWTKNFRDAGAGINFHWQELGNGKLLGSAFALNYLFKTDLYKSKHPLALSLGAGPAIITKTFSLEENRKNGAIGSHVNASVLFRLSQDFNLNKFRLGWIISFQHYSNAAFKIPNLGLNLASLGLSIGWEKPGIPEKPDNGVSDNFPTRALWCFAVVGTKELGDYTGKNYPLGALDLVYTPKSEHVFAYRIFSNLTYYGSIPPENNSFKVLDSGIEKLEANSSPLQVGIGFGADFRVGKTSICLDQGWYLFSNQNQKNNRFNQLMVQHQLSERLAARIMLRSQLARADFMGIGVGYKLWQP
ncbi:MAG: acyloxyacyl hydrolase, partial [Luteibaculum sp.]